MKKQTIAITILIVGIAAAIYLFFNDKKIPEEATIEPSYTTLVWSDEFNGTGAIDQEKWFQQTQLPPGGSWWGGLIQHYTNQEENAYVKDGYLHLTAIKEEFEDQGEIKQYTSARLNSKFAFTYGRVEVSAKLPAGKGTWPAVWLLSKNINEDGAYWEEQGFGAVNWPNCGEIDILEHWGKNPNYVSSAVHNGSSYGDKVVNLGGQKVADVSNQFHLYAIEWTKDKMVFSVDGKVHFEYNPTIKNADTWPYDTDYYLILNIAIEPDIDPEFTESAMEIDYIRIYK